MPTAPARAPDLLSVTPRRNADWETAENGLVVVLAPRLSRGSIARSFAFLVRRPHIRVKLDARGSAVWRACDGTTCVADIAAGLRREFGDEIEPLYDRIEVFLQRLEHAELIEIQSADIQQPAPRSEDGRP